MMKIKNLRSNAKYTREKKKKREKKNLKFFVLFLSFSVKKHPLRFELFRFLLFNCYFFN